MSGLDPSTRLDPSTEEALMEMLEKDRGTGNFI